MKILAPILMALLLVQTFSNWVIVLEYHLNKDFIAQNLCINKARPKLHCNGKCQMMKKLAEQEKQNSTENNNTAKIKIEQLVFTDEINKPSLPSLNFVRLSFNEETPIAEYSSPIASVFHPPAIG